jgi:hypothetical protein
MIFGAIILIQQKRLHLGLFPLNLLPTISDAIGNEITGHTPLGAIEVEPIVVGKKNAIRGHRFFGLEIMVSRLDDEAALPFATKFTYFDRCFGIQ